MRVRQWPIESVPSGGSEVTSMSAYLYVMLLKLECMDGCRTSWMARYGPGAWSEDEKRTGNRKSEHVGRCGRSSLPVFPRRKKDEEYVSLRISVSMLWNYILLAQPLRHRNRRSSQRVDSEG